MGYNIRPKDLADLGRWDADLKITCRSCGRWAVFELLPILNHFKGRGWNTSWGCVAARFICKGTPQEPGCGSKRLRAGLAPRPQPPRPEPILTELQMRQKTRRERH